MFEMSQEVLKLHFRENAFNYQEFKKSEKMLSNDDSEQVQQFQNALLKLNFSKVVKVMNEKKQKDAEKKQFIEEIGNYDFKKEMEEELEKEEHNTMIENSVAYYKFLISQDR